MECISKLENYQNMCNLKLRKIKAEYDRKINNLNSTINLLTQKLSITKQSEKQVRNKVKKEYGQRVTKFKNDLFTEMAKI